MVYVKSVDNNVGLLFAAAVFCDLVEIYVAKKNEKYFSEYKTVAEYMAAKRDRKQNASKPTRANDQRIQKQQKDQLDRLRKQREDRANNRQFAHDVNVKQYIQPDSPEGYRIKKRGDAARDTSSQARKNGGGSDANPKRIRKLRDQTSDRSESEPEEESYNPRQQERTRSHAHVKQDQLNELANVRRSTRLTRRSELPISNEPEVIMNILNVIKLL